MAVLRFAIVLGVLSAAAAAVAQPVHGDFNGDGYGDLAIGVVQEDVGAVYDAGAVTVLYGTAAGLNATGSQVFQEDTPGFPEVAEPRDFLGCALVGADFDGDRFSDLAIGAQGDDAVIVLRGSPVGLSTVGSQIFDQAHLGVPVASRATLWGCDLAAADFNGDGRIDLAVGGPGGGVNGGSGVNMIYSSGEIRGGGLSSIGTQLWNQDSPGIADVAESGDDFRHNCRRRLQP